MTKTTSSAGRATLIIGYGAFGREVLERLLASAAPRGVLEWQAPGAGAGANERALRDLALLHVPDRINAEAESTETGARTGAQTGAAGLLGDLYRQIRVLEARGSAEEDLADAAVAVAEQLLSATARAGRDDALPLGLDVIVLARPDAPEVLGILDRMLAAAMDALANNANLVRAVHGAQALNFVEILDFENYWDVEGQRIRRAIASSLEQWQRRRAAGRPVFGRVYLVDGRTADGIRGSRHRTDEISLFLELLLFEGQRGGELQSLWQPVGLEESPLATFGIRLVERSAGLLSRLAAARFAVDWLEYLAGEKSPEGEPTGLELDQRLAPYRAADLDRQLGGDALRVLLAGRMRDLEEELLAAWLSVPEEPEPVLARYQEAARAITAELAAEGGARMDEIHRQRLAGLREDLDDGIGDDLHHDRRPVPLGAVIRRLEQVAAALDREPPIEPAAAGEEAAAAATGASGPAEPLERARRRLAELAERYLRFRRRLAAPRELRQWWPLWSIALAAGLAPILGVLLAEIPPPEGTEYLLVQAYAVLQWLLHPVAFGLFLFVGFWGLGDRLFQRRIDRLRKRAEAFFLDPRRGRFADRLRAELGAEGSLGAPLRGELDHLLDDMTLAVRSEVHRELGQALVRLTERRREMLWLRDELRDFLTLHGIDVGGGGRHPLDRQRRDGTGIRVAVERGADLERMLERNPPIPERFRSTQADLRPFDGWRRRYSDAFLYPLPFLDRLSRLYNPSALDEAGALADPAGDFLEFLDRSGAFDLAFGWKAQEGLPADRSYCLLPAAWQRLPGVLARLADLRITEDRVVAGPDSARAYLLRVRSGVARECLEEIQPRMPTAGGSPARTINPSAPKEILR